MKTITESQEPLFIDSGMNAPRPDLPFVERNSITAVVRDPKTGKYLGLRWKRVDWETLVTGGIEPEQSPEEAARTEIAQETGYANLRLICELPPYHSQFFHHPKGVNRFAHFRCFFFELQSDEKSAVKSEERAEHEPVWLSKEELERFRLPEGHRFTLENAYAA
jgi:8-oxo-dGTP pyrophosphatase MutT (NUDIX family)